MSAITSSLITGVVSLVVEFLIARYTSTRQLNSAYTLEYFKTAYEARLNISQSVLPQLENLLRQLETRGTDYCQQSAATAGIAFHLQQLVQANEVTTQNELQSAKYLQQLWIQRQEVLDAGEVVWKGDWNRLRQINTQFIQTLQAIHNLLDQQLLR
jgi:hypothetical protein